MRILCSYYCLADVFTRHSFKTCSVLFYSCLVKFHRIQFLFFRNSDINLCSRLLFYAFMFMFHNKRNDLLFIVCEMKRMQETKLNHNNNNYKKKRYLKRTLKTEFSKFKIVRPRLRTWQKISEK